jgi:hypothetical protein
MLELVPVKEWISLWIDKANPSTGRSAKTGVFRSNPYLGMLAATRPYMGVPFLGDFLDLGDLSTPNPTYPQIIATYPQIICLDVAFRQNKSPKYGQLFWKKERYRA